MRRGRWPGGDRDRRAPGAREGAGRGIRSFVAVLLPDAVRARVAAASTDLRGLAAAVSWVRAENLHVTLRFLGAVDEGALPGVRDALEEAARGTAAFTITLGGLGGFPSSRAPRVLWAGVTAGGDGLAALYGRMEAALARRGIPPEPRPFHAHVTLGRVREPREADALGAALERHEEFGEVVVEAVHLMRSELDPAGARYSVLARAPLGGAGGVARVDSPEGGP